MWNNYYKYALILFTLVLFAILYFCYRLLIDGVVDITNLAIDNSGLLW